MMSARAGYQLWLQAFGCIATPFAVLLLFTCFAAITKLRDIVLIIVSVLYIFVGVSWFGISNGARIFSPDHELACSVLCGIWVTINLGFLFAKLIGHCRSIGRRVDTDGGVSAERVLK